MPSNVRADNQYYGKYRECCVVAHLNHKEVEYYEDHECIAPSDRGDYYRCPFSDRFRTETPHDFGTCGGNLSSGSFAASRL